jgi:adenine-specific DNA-methyltransferase
MDLFNEQTAPKTEGIKYAGSKLKLLNSILQVLSEVKFDSVLDGFSGTTRVSQMFAKLGHKVISNDISTWSKTFGNTYLINKEKPKYYKELIDHLNSINGYHGWFTEFYSSEDLQKKKSPFQTKNTKKLDAIRDEIDKLKLNEIEYSVALTALIRALDSVDNTMGHYVAYLSQWSPRSYNDLVLQIPSVFENKRDNVVVQSDILETINSFEVDLAYFDPPYGSNNEKMPPSRVRYNSYYHIWTTIIKNDKPEIFGAANRRYDSKDAIAGSVFEEFRKDENGHYYALNAIRQLIQNTNAKYILLSYSNGGRATKEELFDILNSAGKILKIAEINYKKNVMANMSWTNEWISKIDTNVEFLILLERN